MLSSSLEDIFNCVWWSCLMSMCAFVSRCVYVHALNVHARNAHLPLKRGVCWDTVRVRPLHLPQYNIHAFSGSTSLSGTALSHYKFLSFSAYIHACLESELSVSRGNIFRHLTALRGVFTLRLKINSSAAVNFKVKRSKKRLTFWEMNHFFFFWPRVWREDWNNSHIFPFRI